MKKMMLVIFALLVFTARAEVKPLEIIKVAPGLYVYRTYNIFKGKEYSANAMFMVTKKGVVLFDVPWQRSQYRELQGVFNKRFGKKLLAVFVTHFHDDRAGDLSFYNNRGIATYATEKTNMLLRRGNKAVATHIINTNKTYTMGGKSFMPQYFGEGHSADNIVIWFPKERVLDGGCLVKSAEAKDLGNLADANVKAWPATMKLLAQQHPDAKLVIPGHDDWKLKGHIANTMRLLAESGE